MAGRFFTQFLLLIGLLLICTAAAAAAEPLSKEDIMLVVLSGATPEKKAEIIEQRGISFPMSSEIADELGKIGTEDVVLSALENACCSLGSSKPPATSCDGRSRTLLSARPLIGTARKPSPNVSDAANGTANASRTPAKLLRPSDALLAKIIQEFICKDAIFRKALNNYSYHQAVVVKQIDENGKVVGVYHREWDNVFDDNGKQISRATYAPPASLKRISIKEEGATGFEQILFTSEVGADCDFEYLDHVQVDKITAYVFSVRPKQIEPGKHYFEGTIWVDDQDLQVVKADGRRVPAMRAVDNRTIRETLFPHFVEYRQQIDGKYWFPTVDFSDDTLQFAFGRVHVQVSVKYSTYRSFGAESRLMSSESDLAVPRGLASK